MAAPIFHALQDSALAHLISKSHYLVGAGLQVVHIAGLILLLAAVLLIDLRLLGQGLQRQTPQQVSRAAAGLIWIGLALALSSGVLMFVSAAVKYADNPAFAVKLLLLAAVLPPQLWIQRRLGAGSKPPPFPRAVAASALLVWFSVAVAGRAIGFI
ncbi:MAG: hypothetical protein C0434_07210 [Xanthomonadaceae bacterium]|nr:hypothetical protein [Xanthomonadaceae bacterium]